MLVQSTNSVKEHKIKCVISGISGAGKTTQVKTLKQGGYKPLIISFESGLLSISGSGIDFIDGSKDDSGNVIAKELRIKRLSEIYQFILQKEVMEKYDTIFIDSLTEISQCMYDSLRKEYPENKENLVLYGVLAQKMRDLIKGFRDIHNYHVVFSCLTKIEKDDNGRRFAGFDLIGSISDKLPGFFDEVLYLRATNDGTREFVCSPTENIIAKDRSSKLEHIEKADLGYIFNKILVEENNKKEK